VYTRTPSRMNVCGSVASCGQMTLTCQPAAPSAAASDRTRRSSAKGMFWITISAAGSAELRSRALGQRDLLWAALVNLEPRCVESANRTAAARHVDKTATYTLIPLVLSHASPTCGSGPHPRSTGLLDSSEPLTMCAAIRQRKTQAPSANGALLPYLASSGRDKHDFLEPHPGMCRFGIRSERLPGPAAE
jgi:hypothetical protein